MSNIVVADTSCLIALSKIGKLELLKQLFTRILIPKAVYHEVVQQGKGRAGSQEVATAKWIETRAVNDVLATNTLKLQLGSGESEAIVLAVEVKADFIVLDDWRARQAALGLELPVVGTVAVLAKAVQKNYLSDLPSTLDALKTAGFYFSQHERVSH